MYNIIQSKYRYIFLICILCILAGLFINSTKIVEGAKGNKTTKEETKAIQSAVNAKLPALVRGILGPTVEDIKKTQTETSSKLSDVSNKQNSLNRTVQNVNTKIKTTAEKQIGKITEEYNNKISDLDSKTKSLTTGVSVIASDATDAINKAKQEAIDASEKARQSALSSDSSADRSQKISDDIFGASTTRTIQQDNKEFAGFTTITKYSENLFNLEKALVDSINDFNTTYYNYVRCSSGETNNCSGYTVASISAKADVVIQASADLKTAYTSENINTDDKTFESNHKEIMEKAKTIDEFRRTLDTKMDEIIKNKNPPNELTRQYDSTVYTGIMWSVLATSVLFYIFTEI